MKFGQEWVDRNKPACSPVWMHGDVETARRSLSVNTFRFKMAQSVTTHHAMIFTQDDRFVCGPGFCISMMCLEREKLPGDDMPAMDDTRAGGGAQCRGPLSAKQRASGLS